MKNSLKPAFHNAAGQMNGDLLAGLDRLLDEMAKRDMKAVIYLNNFWEWSGGMGTYLSWVNGGHYIDLGDPTHPWPEFPLFNMQFYANEAANEAYRSYVEALVTRTNSVNGRAYAEDPTIMAWQLANEPRPGYSPAPGMAVLDDYYVWVADTAAFIKRFDPNHLVSTGSEGTVGCADDATCYMQAHQVSAIDYLTFHMWPKNWSWLDDRDMAGTMDTVERNSRGYIADHTAMARRLGKPIVLEEFGFPRDEGALAADASVDYRNQYYGLVFKEVERQAAEAGPLSGTNFWTWGGEGRAEHPDFVWRVEDRSYTGDPPQEAQGLNSVFNSDETTLALIKAHDRELARRVGDPAACAQRD
ncbi:MAG: cellulase family glycosylhydrolase [Hyphomonas sp.]